MEKSRPSRLFAIALLLAFLLTGAEAAPVFPDTSKTPSAGAAPASPAPKPTSAPAAKPPSSSAPAPNVRPTAPAVQSPPMKRITEGQIDFCNLIRHCGIPEPAGYCPAPADLPKPPFTYSNVRCLEARQLNSRGVTPAHPVVGYKLYRFLGMEYRVIYNVEDYIPISEARLSYLLGNLPLAARLVSHFQKEPYTAEYLDAQHMVFKGTKGKRLRGEARLISGDAQEKRLFYFGYGVAEVAWWKLKGPALMDFTYAADQDKSKGLKYTMKLLVFPGSGVINSIMNLGVFRKVVLSKVKEVLVDITESARKLANGGGNELLKRSDWTAEEKRQIEEFLKLP